MNGRHRAEPTHVYHVLRSRSRQIDLSRGPLMAHALPLSTVHLGRVWQEVLPDPVVSQGGPLTCDSFCKLQIPLARPARTQDFESIR